MWHTEEDIQEEADKLASEKVKEASQAQDVEASKKTEETKDIEVVEPADYKSWSDIPDKEKKHYGIQ